jgi:predicted metalloprotease
MRQSDNVEDRRGMGGGGGLGGFGFGGGGGFRPSGMGGLGIGGLLIVLVISWLLGVNPLSLLNGGSGGDQYAIDQSAPGAGGGSVGAPSDEAGKFASSVLGDTEDFWTAYFRNAGSNYPAPRLVLFTDAVQSACGTSSAAVGPFYCPGDHKLYLDLSFFQELAQRFGAPGQFAQAYVIAHEVGHHVQTLLGLLNRGNPVSRTQANAISVQQELQADCLAGMWGHSAAQRNKLEPGDAEAGLRAAAAIGDDTLQRASQGRVVPESFTHGSSEQRVAALRQGLNSTDLSACGAGR